MSRKPMRLLPLCKSTLIVTDARRERLVGESNVTGHVHGEWAGAQGGGAPAEIRMLHLFRLRDGLNVYENTWFDSGAVFRQVEAWKTAQG